MDRGQIGKKAWNKQPYQTEEKGAKKKAHPLQLSLGTLPGGKNFKEVVVVAVFILFEAHHQQQRLQQWPEKKPFSFPLL